MSRILAEFNVKSEVMLKRWGLGDLAVKVTQRRHIRLDHVARAKEDRTYHKRSFFSVISCI